MTAMIWDETRRAFVVTSTDLASESWPGDRWRPDQVISLSSVSNVTVGEVVAAIKDARRSPAADAEYIELSVSTDLPEKLLALVPPSELKENDTFYWGREYYSLQDNGRIDIEIDTRLIQVASATELLEAIEPLCQAVGPIKILKFKASDSGIYHGDIELHVEVPEDLTLKTVSTFASAIRSICIAGVPGTDGPLGHYASIAISRGAALLGQVESESLDVKRDIYDLSTEYGKYDLAMDIAAFANSTTGGAIVVGAATRRDSFGRDIVCSTGGVPASRMPNIQRLSSIIEDRIVPSVEGLSLNLIETEKNPLLIITIPPQEDFLKPYLVKGMLVDSGKVAGSGFTISSRIRSDNVPMSAQAVHSLLIAGRAALRGN